MLRQYHQRLFYQRVQIALQTRLRLRMVIPMRRADEGTVRIDFLEHGAPVGKVGDLLAGLLDQLLGIRGHGIGDGDDLHAAIAENARQMGMAHIAASPHEHNRQSLLRHGAFSKSVDIVDVVGVEYRTHDGEHIRLIDGSKGCRWAGKPALRQRCVCLCVAWATRRKVLGGSFW